MKSSYCNNHQNKECRICKSTRETQKHIPEECPQIHKGNIPRTTEKEVVSQNFNTLREACKKIATIMDEMDKKIPPTPTPTPEEKQTPTTNIHIHVYHYPLCSSLECVCECQRDCECAGQCEWVRVSERVNVCVCVRERGPFAGRWSQYG